MADNPSFLNLDQSNVDNKVNDIQGRIDNITNNLNPDNLSQYKDEIRDINSEIQNLQNTVNSSNLAGSVQQGLGDLASSFDMLNQKTTQMIEQQVQKFNDMGNSVKGIVDHIKSLNEAMTELNRLQTSMSSDSLKSINNEVKELKDNFNKIISVDLLDTESTKKSLNELLEYSNKINKNVQSTAEIIKNSTNESNESVKAATARVLEIQSNITKMMPTQGASDAASLAQQIAESVKQSIGPLNQGVMSTDAQTLTNTTNAIFDAINGRLDTSSVSNINNIGVSAKNAADELQRAIIKMQAGTYSPSEMRSMNKAGLGDVSSLENEINKLLNINTTANNANTIVSNANNVRSRFEEAKNAYRTDNSKENQDQLFATFLEGKKILEQLEYTLAQLGKQTSSLVSDSSVKDWKKGTPEAKDAFKDVSGMLNGLKEASRVMDENFESLNIATDTSKKSLNNLSVTSEKLSETLKQQDVTFGMLGNSIKTALGGSLNTMGLGILGSGSVTNALNQMTQTTFSKSVGYDKIYGEMRYNMGSAGIAQGMGYNESFARGAQQQGIDLFKDTYGKVGVDEYNNTLGGLLKGVQGHYGQGTTKESGAGDMKSLSESALMLSKIYGVDSTNAITTFYKEIGMSASATENTMYKLVQTAQTANIPVSDYIKTISNLSIRFKDLGLNVNAAQTGMRNLTLSGMTSAYAETTMSQVGGAYNKMADNAGAMGYWGMTSGLASNPWQAMNMGANRWDANGNVRQDSQNLIIAAMDENLKRITSVYGNNKDVKEWGATQTLKSMGVTDAKTASMLSQRYLSGDMKGFNDLLSKESNAPTVKLENQQSLEDTFKENTEHLSALTKADAAKEAMYQKWAKDMGGMLTSIGKLEQKIASIGTFLNGNTVALGLLTVAVGANTIAQVGGLKNLGSLFKGGKGLAAGETVAAEAGAASSVAGTARSGFAAANGAMAAKLGVDGLEGTKALSKGLKIGSKLAAPLAIIGGAMDGYTTYNENIASGHSESYAKSQAVGSGVGSVAGTLAGAAGGAAIGTMILPGIGTIIGGAIGGIAASSLGSSAGKGIAGLITGEDKEASISSENPSISDSTGSSSKSSGMTYGGAEYDKYSDMINNASGQNELLKIIAELVNKGFSSTNDVLNKMYQNGGAYLAAPSDENTAAKTVTPIAPTETTVAAMKGTIAQPLVGGKAVTTSDNRNLRTDLLGIGALTALKESNSNAGTVSQLAGDSGGRSYGLYQFANNYGVVADYVNSLKSSNSGWYNELSKHMSGNKITDTSGFDTAFKSIAQTSPDEFAKSQTLFAKNTFYDKTVSGVSNVLDVNKYSDALKSIVFSTSINSGAGGAQSIIKKALSGKNVSSMSEADIITAITNQRESNVFGNAYSKSLTNRYEDEKNIALNSLMGTSSVPLNPLTINQLSPETQKAMSNIPGSNYGKAPVYVMGSVEYSNGSQHYNSSAFKTTNPYETSNNANQALARIALTDSLKGKDRYAAVVDAYDNKGSAYNKNNANFQINVNANGSGNWNQMAEAIQAAIGPIVKQFMGTSTNIAVTNQQRYN